MDEPRDRAGAPPPPFAAELHLSPLVMIAILVAAGWVLGFAAEFATSPLQVAGFALVLIALGAAGWLILPLAPRLGRAYAVAAPALVLYMAHVWLGVEGILPLLAVPAALATALISFRATLVTAGLETAALFLCGLWWPDRLGWHSLAVALLSIWATVATVYAICLPIDQLERWLWDYYRRAQGALEEARSRRAELEGVIADLGHANRQLALANERMAAMRQVAEEAQKSKAAFLAKVSHEFRTPLNMIIGLVELLTETPDVYGHALPEALFQDLKIVRRNCDHLAGLINDVLDLSQAEAGRLVLRKERVSLASVVEEALGVVRTLLDKKGLAVEVGLPEDLPQVYCDRTRIRQVILNLVSNAVRFTDRGGIAVRAWQQGEMVVLSVADTGPGIPPADLERIFEPFSQGSSGPWRERAGSGLGLSISKQFIEMHGGQIWVDSRPGAGTTFSFDLPTSPPLAPPVGLTRWVNEDWKWHERASRPNLPDIPLLPRVVVCDRTGELYPALARHSDQAEFVEARDLGQALQMVDECPAHVLLLNSPDPSGLWSLAEQAQAGAGDTPLAVCCVPPQQARTQAAGAADYLVRPVTRARLLEAIRRLARPVTRILIVDDEADVRQLLARMLSVEPGWDITTASNGLQALEELRAEPPDLMLLDIVMPGMDGWQVLRSKSADPAISDIPVILVSAQDRLEQPPSSPGIWVTMGEGIPLSKLVSCALGFSASMLRGA